MKWPFGLIFSLILSLAAIHVQSAEFTPVIGYRWGGSFKDASTDETLNLDSGRSYGLKLAVDYEADGQLEVFYSRQETNLKPNALFSDDRRFELDMDYFHFGGVRFYQAKGVVPFVAGSLGITHMSPHRSEFDSETRLSLGVGGGIKWPISHRADLHLEGRALSTFIDSAGEIFCANGRCVVHVKSDAFWQLEASAGVTIRF